MTRILVVDDEEDLREILRFNLEAEGFEVETAASAEEALDLITHHSSLITDHSITIDVSGLTSGAYFVRIVGAHTTAVRKLIVR